jgi:vacuolar-type H+-ATPase subunit H
LFAKTKGGCQMDVLDVLNAIEFQIKESPSVPLANRRAVDRAVLLPLLAALRGEIERSQQTPAAPLSRDEVLKQAINEGRLLLEAARREADTLLREDRIKRLTRQRFDEIVDEGREQANKLMQDAYGYSAERLAEAEARLKKLSEQLATGLETLGKGLKETEKERHQRKREARRQRRRKG